MTQTDHDPTTTVPLPDPGSEQLLVGIRQYDFASRLEILERECGFLPTGHQEANDAFDLWYSGHLTGDGADDYLNRVASHQALTSTERPQSAVDSVVTRYGSYARQAERDMGVLLMAGRELFTDPAQPDSTLTLGQLLRHEPASQGPGQLVRYYDLKRTADEGDWRRLGFDPYSAEVRKPGIGSVGVIDAYTTNANSSEISAHITEVLSGILAADGQQLVEAAVNDQESRLVYWAERLIEARGNTFGNYLATMALNKLRNYQPHDLSR